MTIHTFLCSNKFGCLIEIAGETTPQPFFNACYDGGVMSKADAFAAINSWISTIPGAASRFSDLTPEFSEDDAAGLMFHFICRAIKEPARKGPANEIDWHVKMISSLLESNYWYAKIDRDDSAITAAAATLEPVDEGEFERRIQQATIGGF